MKKRKSAYLLCFSLLGALFLGTGCSDDKNASEIEQAIYSVLPSYNIVKVEESNSGVKLNGEELKNVKIILNLEEYSKSIIYNKSLQTVTNLLSGVDFALENKVNNYTILINSSDMDIYGNAQKVKVLEVNIDKETVDKINFDNFKYSNLDKIAEVKKFKYLTQE